MLSPDFEAAILKSKGVAYLSNLIDLSLLKMKKIVSWSAIIFLAVAVYLNVFLTLEKMNGKEEVKIDVPVIKEHVEVKQQLETLQQKRNVDPSALLSW